MLPLRTPMHCSEGNDRPSGNVATLGSMPPAAPCAKADRLRVARIEELDFLATDWQRLGALSGNIFATWEWTSLWWQVFGQRGETRVAAWFDENGSAVGILPLYARRTAGMTVLRFMGHGPSDIVGPVVPTHDQARVVSEIPRGLDCLGRWNLFLAGPLEGSLAWSTLPGAIPRGTQPAYVIRPHGRTWAQYLKTRSPRLQKHLRRYHRRLDTMGSVTFRVSTPSTVRHDFDTFYRLHELRWRGLSEAFSGARHEFHREFAFAASARGWLRLVTLEVDGEAVAAWYGFRFGGADWFYQAGRNPAWDDYNIGLVLLTETIKYAFDDNMTQYRFLRGADSYKARLADTATRLEAIAFTKGSLGRLPLNLIDRYRRLRPSVRREAE